MNKRQRKKRDKKARTTLDNLINLFYRCANKSLAVEFGTDLADFAFPIK